MTRKYTAQERSYVCPICGEPFVGRDRAVTDKSACRNKLSRLKKKGLTIAQIVALKRPLWDKAKESQRNAIPGPHQREVKP